VLRQVAEPVDPASIRTPAIQRLIDDMIETMREYDGAGLAATQVHTLKQIAVVEVLGNPRYPDAPVVPLMVLINPVLTPLTDEMEEGWRLSLGPRLARLPCCSLRCRVSTVRSTSGRRHRRDTSARVSQHNPRKSGTERQPSQPSSISSVSGVRTD